MRLWLWAHGRWPLAAGLGLLAGAAAAQEVFVPLHEGWSFQQVGKEEWYPAEVPGTVHDDLLRNGLIPDPMRNANIDSVQWVENEDWTYTTRFNADTLAHHEHIDLVFKGLDTFAEVYLNDSLLGMADNMFRQWEWPMKGLLRPGTNELKVVFRSAIKEGAKLRDAYGIQLPHDNDPSGVSPYVRKAAYQFGWDFAPRLVGCGIWREVGLRGWDRGRIVWVDIDMFSPDSTGLVDLAIDEGIQLPRKAVVRLKYSLLGDHVWDTHWQRSAPLWGHDVRLYRKGVVSWLPKSKPVPTLYAINIELEQEGDLIDKWVGSVGASEWYLNTQKDSIGRRFQFERDDGERFFVKGANVIPPNTLPCASSDSLWTAIVRAAKSTGMNMLRVWAGGVYPPQAFFNACDSAGILVWQDFMLANPSPVELTSGRSLDHEVRDQLRELDRHTSLALWCGNNELDVAWKNWGWYSKYEIANADRRLVDRTQKRLFTMDLKHRVAPNRTSYTPTSPLSNWGNAEGLKSGDLHYWGVWHGDSAFSSFRNNVGRFVSEYGFQSYPDSVTLAHYIDPEHLYLGSPMLAKRQKSYKTDKPIWTAIEREMGEKPTTLGRFIDCSQVMQAEAYRIAIWAHRTNQPHCMGTLYWQLNDVWAAPTWSTIDVDGRWKAAHYEVTRSYSDRVLAFEPTATGGTALELWSDTELNGDSVVLELWSDAGQLVGRKVHRLEGSGKKRLVEWPKDGFPLGTVAYAFGCGAEARCHRAEVLKTMNGAKPKLTLTPVPGSPGEWETSSPVPVRIVEVVTGRGEQPSDNWFPLVPGHSKRFKINPLDAVPQLSTFLR